MPRDAVWRTPPVRSARAGRPDRCPRRAARRHLVVQAVPFGEWARHSDLGPRRSGSASASGHLFPGPGGRPRLLGRLCGRSRQGRSDRCHAPADWLLLDQFRSLAIRRFRGTVAIGPASEGGLPRGWRCPGPRPGPGWIVRRGRRRAGRPGVAGGGQSTLSGIGRSLGTGVYRARAAVACRGLCARFVTGSCRAATKRRGRKSRAAGSSRSDRIRGILLHDQTVPWAAPVALLRGPACGGDNRSPGPPRGDGTGHGPAPARCVPSAPRPRPADGAIARTAGHIRRRPSSVVRPASAGIRPARPGRRFPAT